MPSDMTGNQQSKAGFAASLIQGTRLVVEALTTYVQQDVSVDNEPRFEQKESNRAATYLALFAVKHGIGNPASQHLCCALHIALDGG